MSSLKADLALTLGKYVPSTKKEPKDGKYFSTTKKGELHELKNELCSLDKDKIKEAVKKTIASMTVGKDVSSLFIDVVKNMITTDIELKKLIYLYIINYARSQPDKAILVVNTFQNDASDPSPLIRALAIRTLGCIRVDRITEHLCVPLGKALADVDPYVRKTAAVCVAKLYDINPDLVEEQGFLDTLRSLVSDPNPMVVANAVAALSEIADQSQKDVLQINSGMLTKLLNALNDCTEWGQVSILDCLAKYVPRQEEAEEIIERVGPRLKHANSAVSMSAIKVIINYLPYIARNEELTNKLITEKLPPPLVTLLAEQNKPEIQYVALRNINVIVQAYPAILANGVKHFFCKYNDPLYVKMEKLDIMVELANSKNVEKLLLEFKEYASEIDVNFVRKSVLAIGKIAVKFEKAAERCLSVLEALIRTKVNYVVQEAIIVTKDIFRKYPNRFESIISALCENLENLDEPEAKASMIWIIGEYSDRIDNAPELLEQFLESFSEEDVQVQLQLLTAVVKLFLTKPQTAKDMVTKTLDLATNSSQNADLRDRGYIYWRLLSTDPAAAKAVVMAKRPAITDKTSRLDDTLLATLIRNMSTLASVYHKPPEFFLKDGKKSMLFKQAQKDPEESSEEEDAAAEESGGEQKETTKDSEEDESESDEEEKKKPKKPKDKPTEKKTQNNGSLDLLNLDAVVETRPVNVVVGGGSGGAGGGAGDLEGLFDIPGFAPAATTSSSIPMLIKFHRVAVNPSDKGVDISLGYSRSQNTPQLHLQIDNQTGGVLDKFAIKFNSNYLGIANKSPLTSDPIAAGATGRIVLPLTWGPTTEQKLPGIVQMALKIDKLVVYFQDSMPAYLLFDDEGRVEKRDFPKMWSGIEQGASESLPSSLYTNSEDIKNRLDSNRIFYIATRNVDRELSYYSATLRGVKVLVEVAHVSPLSICVKSTEPDLATHTLASVKELLTTR